MGRRCKGPLGWAALLVFSLSLPGSTQDHAVRAAHAGHGESAQAAGLQPGAVGEITIEGCNDVDSILTPKGTYWLAGDTSPLRPYRSQLVRILVRHVIHSPYGTAAEFVRFEKTLSPARAVLNNTVRDSPRWESHRNREYGVRFALPATFPAIEVDHTFEDPDFLFPQGTVDLASYEIPLDTYHGPDLQRVRVFAGGFFGIFANPEITNLPFCLRFGSSNPGTLFWLSVAGITYRGSTWVAAAGGSSYSYYTLHAFKNRMCYAVTVEMAQVNSGNVDGGCMLPVITPQQQRDLVRRLLEKFAFSRPRTAPAGKGASSPPLYAVTPRPPRLPAVVAGLCARRALSEERGLGRLVY
jgi:hypothetical protein